MAKANQWTAQLLRDLQKMWNKTDKSPAQIIKELALDMKDVSLVALVTKLRQQGYHFRSRVKVKQALTFLEIAASAGLEKTTGPKVNLQSKKRVKEEPAPEKNVELAAHLNAPQPEVVLNAKGQPQKNVYRVTNIDALPKHRLADHPASPRELEALDFG